MRALVAFFARRHLLVNVSAAALLTLGLLAAGSLQREFIPSVNTPIFWITASLPGASARDVETKVSIPIAQALESVEGIEAFTSVISDSVSFTTVELLPSYDAAQIEAAKRDLRAALNDITDFPAEMDDPPQLKQFNPARSTVIEVALTGPSSALATAADDLERRIERLPQVSSVTVVGVTDPEVRVLVDPQRAREHGVTLIDVLSAIRQRNVSSTGGVLESAEDRRQVVLWSRYTQPDDVADTILRFHPSGGALRVGDISRIEAGREDTGLRMQVSGEAGALLLVHKRESADIIDAARTVRQLVSEAPLPEGVKVQFSGDESWIVANRLDLMARNGALGALLVMVVLFLFVRWRPAVWILLGIPVVFLGSIALFGQLGMSLNIVSLTGFIIVLGMVVDDAVVVAERVVRKQAQGLSPARAAIEGTTEVVRPVTAAALTTMLAFLPLAYVGGRPGDIIWQIPVVVVLVLLLSLLESFFILPAHLSTMRDTSADARPFMRRLEDRYRIALRWTLNHRRLVLGVAMLALVLVFALIGPRVPFVLFPQDDADRLFIKLTAPAGTSIEQTAAISAAVERQLMEASAPDLELVTARIGHQNSNGLDKRFGEAENEALVTLQFKPLDRRHTNAEWMARLPGDVRIPDHVHAVYLSEYFGPPTDQPVTVHVMSNEDTVRRTSALQIADYLRAQPGVVEIHVDEQPGTPQIDLNLRHEKLALRGLDAATVGNTLAAAFTGIKASEHRELDATTELRVLFDPAARPNLDALLDTQVRARSGDLVPLRDVVAPVEVPASSRIYHRDGYRTATVRASFDASSDHTALAFAAKLEEELFPRYADTADLIVFNGGEARETAKTTASTGIAGALAVAGIAVVLWLLLGSLLEALFVMLAIPFAIAAVHVVFFLHGKPLSLFALLGAVGLAGVVVNASIVMVDAIHRRLRHQTAGETGRTELIIDAVVERLRPILVSALTTLGGVVPTAYGIGGYDAIVSVISLAVGWGLAASTLVTLFIMPALYVTADELRGPR